MPQPTRDSDLSEDRTIPLDYATPAARRRTAFWPSVLKALGIISLPFALISAISLASAASDGSHNRLVPYCAQLVGYSFFPLCWLLYGVRVGRRAGCRSFKLKL